MVRYFFDFQANGTGLVDDIGTEFDDFAAMRQEALHALPTFAADQAARHGNVQNYRLIVRNAYDVPVFGISMALVSQAFDPI